MSFYVTASITRMIHDLVCVERGLPVRGEPCLWARTLWVRPRPALRSQPWGSSVDLSQSVVLWKNICHRGLLNTLLCPWDICLLSHWKGPGYYTGNSAGQSSQSGFRWRKHGGGCEVGQEKSLASALGSRSIYCMARIGAQGFPLKVSPAVSLTILGNGFKLSFLVWS